MSLFSSRRRQAKRLPPPEVVIQTIVAASHDAIALRMFEHGMDFTDADPDTTQAFLVGVRIGVTGVLGMIDYPGMDSMCNDPTHDHDKKGG